MTKINPKVGSILNSMKQKNAKIGQIIASKPEEAEEKKTKQKTN